ncbi:hypothetical protein DL771_002682 [Monosporascus sp. 5C6A]|nr:hypothetical protein DL771_002682 [Monosporascus sp. 5C6A]
MSPTYAGYAERAQKTMADKTTTHGKYDDTATKVEDGNSDRGSSNTSKDSIASKGFLGPYRAWTWRMGGPSETCTRGGRRTRKEKKRLVRNGWQGYLNRLALHWKRQEEAMQDSSVSRKNSEGIEMQSQENETLTRTVGKLQQSLDSKTETAKDLSAQLAKLEDAKKTLASERDAEKAKVAEKEKRLQENAKAVSELQGKLKSSTNSISKLKDMVKEKENQQKETSSLLNKVSKELEGKKAEMATTSEKLKALSQYSCAMATASDEAISKELGRIFATVNNLAKTFFSENLSRSVLGDDDLWKDIDEQIRWLPLPASNTLDAKQMRIAACIAALGSRFVQLIFVPVYQQSDTGGLSGLLSSLAAADAPRETYLRSVLLDVLPEDQTSIRKQRIAEIVRAVCTGIGRLLEDQKKAAFRDGVEEACNVAAECWQKIRLLKTKVDPFMPLSEGIEDAEHFTDEFWQPVPLPLGLPTNKSSQPTSQASQLLLRSASNPKSTRKHDHLVPGPPRTLIMEIGITMATIFGVILLVALIWALFFGDQSMANIQGV